MDTLIATAAVCLTKRGGAPPEEALEVARASRPHLNIQLVPLGELPPFRDLEAAQTFELALAHVYWLSQLLGLGKRDLPEPSHFFDGGLYSALCTARRAWVAAGRPSDGGGAPGDRGQLPSADADKAGDLEPWIEKMLCGVDSRRGPLPIRGVPAAPRGGWAPLIRGLKAAAWSRTSTDPFADVRGLQTIASRGVADAGDGAAPVASRMGLFDSVPGFGATSAAFGDLQADGASGFERDTPPSVSAQDLRSSSGSGAESSRQSHGQDGEPASDFSSDQFFEMGAGDFASRVKLLGDLEDYADPVDLSELGPQKLPIDDHIEGVPKWSLSRLRH